MSEKNKQVALERGAMVIANMVKTLPNLPGVYRMIDANERVLYVGKAKALKKRVVSYTRTHALPLRLKRMVSATARMEIIVTHTEAEALLLEINMIKDLSPDFNILLKDGKSFPYIHITGDHAFPMMRKHRGAQKKKGQYYGPFLPVESLNRTLITLQRAFQVRNCSDNDFATRQRPCLQYHIKRCTAPCVGAVDANDYKMQVADLNAFLSGKGGAIQKKMAVRMEEASEALDFEKAAALRDRIRALSAIQSQQDINISGLGNADLFAIAQNEGRSAIQVFFYRNGQNFGNAAFFPTHDQDDTADSILEAFVLQFYERYPLVEQILTNQALQQGALIEEIFTTRLERKVTLHNPRRGKLARLMVRITDNAEQALARKQLALASEAKSYAALAKVLNMKDLPQRVEIYDNSHTGGQNAVGGMVVAGPEGFKKNAYRQFTIRDAQESDDFDMMREVMRRRFVRGVKERAEGGDENWPDLIIIDGGKGQLSAVMEVLESLDCHDQMTVLSIAKGEEREAGRERLFLPGQVDFMLSPDDPALHLLQRLRDEAHRFAIGTHRKKRDKAMVGSVLDSIPGVGPKRKKLLLSYFGSAKGVEQAAFDDLCRVEGVSKATAQTIYDYFHQK